MPAMLPHTPAQAVRRQPVPALRAGRAAMGLAFTVVAAVLAAVSAAVLVWATQAAPAASDDHTPPRQHVLLHAPGGQRVFLATDQQLVVIDTRSGEAEFNERWADFGPELAPPYAQLRFSADGQRLALLTRAGVLAVLVVPASQVIGLGRNIPADSQLSFADPAGEALAVSGSHGVSLHRVASQARAMHGVRPLRSPV